MLRKIENNPALTLNAIQENCMTDTLAQIETELNIGRAQVARAKEIVGTFPFMKYYIDEEMDGQEWLLKTKNGSFYSKGDNSN